MPTLFNGKHLISCSFFCWCWGNVGVETHLRLSPLGLAGWLVGFLVAEAAVWICPIFGRLLLVFNKDWHDLKQPTKMFKNQVPKT